MDLFLNLQENEEKRCIPRIGRREGVNNEKSSDLMVRHIMNYKDHLSMLNGETKTRESSDFP